MTQSAAFFGFEDAPLTPELSVVAPVFNEEGNIEVLVGEIERALRDKASFEIVFVDDASTDRSADILEQLARSKPFFRAFKLAKNAGQSRALRVGVMAARANLIATLDADGQNDPADILRLAAAMNREGAPDGLAMVAGQRVERHDTRAKRWASALANSVRRKLLNDGAWDSGCGLKLFRRAAFLRMPYFDHIHRYLPALFQREGFGVEFIDVSHRPRKHGVSKYDNWQRAVAAWQDLLGVLWLCRRFRDPGSIEEL